jgi:hypothetical protein
MRGEHLSVVCDNLCEIADAATADVSLDALNDLAYPASNPLRGASLSGCPGASSRRLWDGNASQMINRVPRLALEPIPVVPANDGD